MTTHELISLVIKKSKTLAEKLGGYSGPTTESYKYRKALQQQELRDDLHSKVQNQRRLFLENSEKSEG